MATFFRVGDEVSTNSVHAGAGLKFHDLIFYGGAFRFVTDFGDVMLCVPEVTSGGHLRIRREMVYFIRVLHPPHLAFVCRYLVESRGDLLMVTRYRRETGGATVAFRVYSMLRVRVGNMAEDLYLWDELEALDGRMLFVGRGCSRSYEVSDQGQHGMREGVYFIDDHSFYQTNMVCTQSQGMIYGCVDNGVWRRSPNQVKTTTPAHPVSTTSSPVWFML